MDGIERSWLQSWLLPSSSLTFTASVCLFFLSFFLSFFLRLHLQHMDVPRLGVELEL